jgi:thiosulfate dehydrogenase
MTALEMDVPAEDQPLWASQDTNTRTGSDTWRCKECHGWDYKGAEGAYGSGSHFTGFPGIIDTVASMSPGELLAALDGSANPDHDFSNLGTQALNDLAVFMRDGLVDVSPFIDAQTIAAVGGDAGHGADFYNQNCGTCHGEDGRTLNFGDEEEPEFLGTIAADNPWEFIHKVRMGQPGAEMPAGEDEGWSIQDVVDLMAYAQSLPIEPAVGGSVARGGRLFDMWWVEAGLEEPVGDMPVWGRQDTNTRTGGDTWRCKECHGWDYKGAEGDYGEGSHFTGFPGVYDARLKPVADLLALLTGSVDAEHDFSVLSEPDLNDLVSFLKDGLLDVSPFIDAETKTPISGDADHGQELYTSTCALCHGEDGLTLNFGSEDEPEYVGTIALDNPWEFVHKVRTGQPGSEPPMPAAIEKGWSPQDIIDLLAFAQSLPTESP